MKTPEYITFIINRLPKGYVFTYTDFLTEVNKKEAVIKALNRMVASGKIAKLANGKYYKPENTPFGGLMPDKKQVVKDLLEENGKITGYLTGYSIYNQLGLTTQVSNTIQIGKNEIRLNFKRERYSIAFINQKNTITKENIPLLQILDAIRYIKKIPDATMKSACHRLLAIIKSLSPKDKTTLVRLAQKYPPATKALLGAMLEEQNEMVLSELLRKTLNPITKYRLSGMGKVLSFAEKWNIL
jgi:Family of unknown function (DUF6088)